MRLFRVTAAGAVELSSPPANDFDVGPIVLHGSELLIPSRHDPDPLSVLWGDVSGATPRWVVLSPYRALGLARTAAGTARILHAPYSGTLALSEVPAGGGPRSDDYLWSDKAVEVALSPDGAALAIVKTHDGEITFVRVTDPSAGRPLFKAGSWTDLRFSTDSRRFAAFDEPAGKKPVTRLHVAEDGRALPGVVSFPGSVVNAAMDPTMRVLAASDPGPPGARGWIDFLAVPGGKRLRRVAGLPPTAPDHDSMGFSPDGATLFFTRTKFARPPSGAAGLRHVTQDLWAVAVTGGTPRLLGRILDKEEPIPSAPAP